MAGFNCNKDAFASLRQTTAPQWLEEAERQISDAVGPYVTVELRDVTGDPARGVELAPRRNEQLPEPVEA